MADDDRTSETARILDRLQEAREAVAAYDMELARAAWRNEHPQQSTDVFEAKAEAHVLVLAAFRRLRPFIREHLSPEYWLEAVIYNDGDGRLIQGFKALERMQGRVWPETVEHDRKHQGPQTEVNWNVQLLPGDACRRAVELMDECAMHLGFMEAPSPPSPVYALDSEGGEGEALAENGYEDQTDNDAQAKLVVEGVADS